MVYKDIDEVMAAQADLVAPVARFDPRLCRKTAFHLAFSGAAAPSVSPCLRERTPHFILHSAAQPPPPRLCASARVPHFPAFSLTTDHRQPRLHSSFGGAAAPSAPPRLCASPAFPRLFSDNRPQTTASPFVIRHSAPQPPLRPSARVPHFPAFSLTTDHRQPRLHSSFAIRHSSFGGAAAPPPLCARPAFN